VIAISRVSRRLVFFERLPLNSEALRGAMSMLLLAR